MNREVYEKLSEYIDYIEQLPTLIDLYFDIKEGKIIEKDDYYDDEIEGAIDFINGLLIEIRKNKLDKI